MSNQLQQQLRDLSDYTSKIAADRARLLDLTTQRASVDEAMADGIAWNALEERRWTESSIDEAIATNRARLLALMTECSVDAVDREISAVERVLQQWLAVRSTAQEPRFG